MTEERLALVDVVVRDLVERRGVAPDRLMIVGSEARDHLHHTVFERPDVLRGTQDVDVAMVTDDWDAYESVVDTYPKTGANGVRFIVAGMEVDFMPFGQVEDPEGVVVPAARGEAMSVFGMGDVFRGSKVVELPSGISVRFPSVSGYTLLKLRAWVDRGHSNDKDARDLAIAVDWYCGDATIRDSVWTELDVEILDEYAFDTDLASARLLGRHAAQVVSHASAVELSGLLSARPIRREWFDYSPNKASPVVKAARIDALQAGVADVVDGV